MTSSNHGFIDRLLATVTIALLLATGLFIVGGSLTGYAVFSPSSEDQQMLFVVRPTHATVGEVVVFTVFPDDAKSSVTVRDAKDNIRVVDGGRAVFDAPGVYVVDALIYLGEQKERFSEVVTVEASTEDAQERAHSPIGDRTSSQIGQDIKDVTSNSANVSTDDGGEEHVVDLEWNDLEIPSSLTTRRDASSDQDDQAERQNNNDSQDVTLASSQDSQHTHPQLSLPTLESVRETTFGFFADKATVDVGETVTFFITPADAQASVTLTGPAGTIRTLDTLKATLDVPGIYEAIALIYDGATTERITIEIVAGNASIGGQNESFFSVQPIESSTVQSFLDGNTTSAIVSMEGAFEEKPAEGLSSLQSSNESMDPVLSLSSLSDLSSIAPSDMPIKISAFTQGFCDNNMTDGDTITMIQNIGPCNATGVRISGRGISLNCNGFNITGNSSIGIADGGVGIVVNSSGNVSIRNCNVYNFTIGIVMNATGNQLGNITFDNVNLSNNSIGIIATTQQGQAYSNISLSNMTIFGTAGTCINYNAGAGENTLSNFTNINCMGNFTVSSDNITVRNSTIQNSSLILSGASDSQFMAIYIIASGYENNGIVAGAGSGNRFGNITIRHMFDGISFGVPEFNNSFFSNITIYDTNRSGIILDSNSVRLANLTFYNITIINTSSPGAGGRGIWFNGGRANNTTWVDINVTLGNSLDDVILVGGRNHSFTNVYIFNASGSDAFDFGQVGNAQNITIQNVTISHVSRGFVIQAQNLTIDNVRIYNNSGEALHFTNGTGNVSFTNLTISGEGTGIVVQQSPGVVRFLSAVFNNTIADPTGAASRTLSDSNSGSTGPFYFENTTFLRDVILFWASSSPSIWTNTNFTSTNMGVFFPYVNVTGNTVYSMYTSFSITSNLVVNQSLIALNASALVDWNVSANITRYNANCTNFIILYESAYQTVATNMENDPVVASFRTAAGSDCDSPSSCADVSCANNILSFNVTNWSSYRIHEQPVCGNVLGASSRLYTNVNATGTCFTIAANNVLLNCSGSQINFSNINAGFGINASNVNNLTVRSCNITHGRGSISNISGIYLDGTNNSLVVDTNISIHGGGDVYGIWFNRSSFNNTIRANRIIVNGTSARDYGIYIVSSSGNNTAADNVILMGGNDDRKYGVYIFSSSDNNTVTNNTITAGGAGEGLGAGADDNYGVYVSSSNNNLIRNNTISTGGTDHTHYGIPLSGANDTVVVNNTITTNGQGQRNGGIFLNNSASSNDIFGNTIRTGGTADNYGLEMSNSPVNNNIFNNTFFTNGTEDYNHGMFISGAGSGNNFSDNGINASGSTGFSNGITIVSSANGNNFTLNRIRASSSRSYGIVLQATNETLFSRNRFIDPANWIAVNDDSIVNFSNTTFEGENASLINFYGLIRTTAAVIVNKTRLNLTFNRAYLNSSAISAFNTTAQISLNVSGSGFINPRPMADFNDDGTFANCNSPQCVEQVFGNNIFTFNVSSFTTYSATQGQPNITINKTDSPDPVNQNSVLNFSINVSNNGNDTASNITVVEVYDRNVRFVGADPAPNQSNDTWIIFSIDGDSSFVINISVNVTECVVTISNAVNITNYTNLSSAVFPSPSNDTEDTRVIQAAQCSPSLPDGGGGGSPAAPPGPPPSSDLPAAEEPAAEDMAPAVPGEEFAAVEAPAEVVTAPSEVSMPSAAPSGAPARPAPPQAHMTIPTISFGDVVFFRDNKQVDSISFPAGQEVTFDVLVRNPQETMREEVYLGATVPEGVTIVSISPERIDKIRSGGEALFRITLRAAQAQPDVFLSLILESVEGIQLTGFNADITVGPPSGGARPSLPIPPLAVPVFALSLPIILIFTRLLGVSGRAKNLARSIVGLFYKTTIADDEGLHAVMVKNLQRRYWRIKVPHAVHMKYHRALHNISPISINPRDMRRIQDISHRYKVDIEHATLLLFAERVSSARLLVARDVHPDIQAAFKTVSFVNLLEEKEEKKGILKRLFMLQAPRAVTKDARQRIAMAADKVTSPTAATAATVFRPNKLLAQLFSRCDAGLHRIATATKKRMLPVMRIFAPVKLAFASVRVFVSKQTAAVRASFIKIPFAYHNATVQFIIKFIHIIHRLVAGLYTRGKHVLQKLSLSHRQALSEKPGRKRGFASVLEKTRHDLRRIPPMYHVRKEKAYAWIPGLGGINAQSTTSDASQGKRQPKPVVIGRTPMSPPRSRPLSGRWPAWFRGLPVEQRDTGVRSPVEKQRPIRFDFSDIAAARQRKASLERIRDSLARRLPSSPAMQALSEKPARKRRFTSVFDKIRHDLQRAPLAYRMRKEKAYAWIQELEGSDAEGSDVPQTKRHLKPLKFRTIRHATMSSPRFDSVLAKICHDLSSAAKPTSKKLTDEVLVGAQKGMDPSSISASLKSKGYHEDEIDSAIARFNKAMEFISTWTAQAVKLGRDDAQIEEELQTQGFDREMIRYYKKSTGAIWRKA